MATLSGSGAFSVLPSVYLPPADVSLCTDAAASTALTGGPPVICPSSSIRFTPFCSLSRSSSFVAGGASFAFAVNSEAELSTSTLEVRSFGTLFVRVVPLNILDMSGALRW